MILRRSTKRQNTTLQHTKAEKLLCSLLPTPARTNNLTSLAYRPLVAGSTLFVAGCAKNDSIEKKETRVFVRIAQ